MMTINILWLLLIVPVSMIVSFILALYYIKKHVENQMFEITGFKNFKELREFQKKMNRGDVGGVMAEINKDPKMKKQLEELQKRFGRK